MTTLIRFMTVVVILLALPAARVAAAPYTLTFDYPDAERPSFKTEGGIRWLYDNCYEFSSPSRSVEVHDDAGCGRAGGFVRIEALEGKVFDALQIDVLFSRSLILYEEQGYPALNFDGFVFAGETRGGAIVRRSMRTGFSGELDLGLADLVALTIAPDDDAIAPFRALCFDPEGLFWCPEDGNWNVRARFDNLELDVRNVPIPPAWGLSLLAAAALLGAARGPRAARFATVRARTSESGARIANRSVFAR